MAEESTSLWHVASVITLYWFVSISLVFINKKIVTDESVPLFIVWSQCAVTLGICYVCGTLGERMREDMGLEKNWRTGNSSLGGDGKGKGGDGLASKCASFLVTFPKAEFNSTTAMKIMPLSAVFVTMIIANQLTLRYVEVSFYNVARSPSIIFNALFSVLLLGSSVSWRIVFSLLVVMTGFIVGVEGEVSLSPAGVAWGLISSVAVSLNSIYTKKALPHVQNDAWLLTFNNNANACMLFVPFVWYFEKDALIEKFDALCSTAFMGSLVISGMLGFMMGIVTVMQIRVTSPLTHNISGTAKAGCQSVVAYFVWRNKPNVKACLGESRPILTDGPWVSAVEKDTRTLLLHQAPSVSVCSSKRKWYECALWQRCSTGRSGESFPSIPLGTTSRWKEMLGGL